MSQAGNWLQQRRIFIGSFSILMGIILALAYFSGSQVYSLSSISSLWSQNTYQAQDISRQTKELQDSQNFVREQQSKIDLIKVQLESLRKELLSLQTEEAAAENKLDTLPASLEKINNQIKANEQKLQILESDLASQEDSGIREGLQEQKGKILQVQTDLRDEAGAIAQAVQESTNDLTTIQQQVVAREAEMKAKETEISELNQAILQRQQMAAKQINSLQSSVVFEVWSWIRYIFLLLIYWGIFQLIRLILQKKVGTKNSPNRSLWELALFLARLIWILASLFTLTYIIIDRLELLQQIWTIIAFVSLSISLALKEFVASLFAFFWITTSKHYDKGDIIKIGDCLGRVETIDLFSTSVQETSQQVYSYGLTTGKRIWLPNHIFLTQNMTNFTRQNKIVWHNIQVTLTSSADLGSVKDTLISIAHSQFRWAVDHRDELLDAAWNLENIYRPQVTFFPTKEGPSFNIRFAVRFSKFTVVVENLSTEIYRQLQEMQIGLVKVEAN